MINHPRFIYGITAGVALALAGAAFSELDIEDENDIDEGASSEYLSLSEQGHAVLVVAGDRSDVKITIGPEDPKEGEGHETAQEAVVSVGSLGESLPGDALPAQPGAVPVAPLIQHEGYSDEPYSVGGIKHICYGHNLSASGAASDGWTIRSCIDQLYKDMRNSTHAVVDAVGEGTWTELSTTRQGALTELAFMVGPSGLKEFPLFLAAVHDHNWLMAIEELYDSLLPCQVGEERLADISDMLAHDHNWRLLIDELHGSLLPCQIDEVSQNDTSDKLTND